MAGRDYVGAARGMCTLRHVPSAWLKVLLCFVQLRQSRRGCLQSLHMVQHLHRGRLQPPGR